MVSTIHAAESCQLVKYATLPVTMVGQTPVVTAQINGVNMRMMADSGAWFSTLNREAAERAKLRWKEKQDTLMIRGMGGVEQARIGIAKDFGLSGFRDLLLHDYEFVVASHLVMATVDGWLGQNILNFDDIEYDLANGAISLFHAKNCGQASLAYWSGTRPVAIIDIARTSGGQPHLIGQGKLNDKPLRLLFDTGAPVSVLQLRTAKKLGFKQGDAGVTDGGLMGGFGPEAHQTWIGTFKLLDLGGEQVQNARLRVSENDIGDGIDLVIGADFFLSHRVFVSREQRRIYITYNGGPVFDLRERKNANASVGTSAAPAAAATAAVGDEPRTAADFRLRGLASAARGDLGKALVDLDAAVQRDDHDAENFYHRGVVRQRNELGDLALADYDKALQLAPRHAAALEARGKLRLKRDDVSGAVVDFNALLDTAPGSGTLVMRLANALISAGLYAEASVMLDAWIVAYPKNDYLSNVHANRCRARALGGLMLSEALAECNRSVLDWPRDKDLLDSRALVSMRLGDLPRAIADYRTSLRIQDNDRAWTLYGLGVAELRHGEQQKGQEHLQAATAADKEIADNYRKIGITP